MSVFINEGDYKPLTLAKFISTTELDQAVQWLNSGENNGLDYLSTQRALAQSDEFVKLLRDAAVCDFQERSVTVGVIAGLRLASILLNKQIQFQQETN